MTDGQINGPSGELNKPSGEPDGPFGNLDAPSAEPMSGAPESGEPESGAPDEAGLPDDPFADALALVNHVHHVNHMHYVNHARDAVPADGRATGDGGGQPPAGRMAGSARPDGRAASGRTPDGRAASGGAPDGHASPGPGLPRHFAAPQGPTASGPPSAAVPWRTARHIAGQAVPGPPPPVTAALGEALGRTLAAPLTALTDLPSFDTSAMDGWAVAGPGPWRLDQPADAPAAAEPPGILAGHAPTEALPDGHAIPIATGARIPAGATAVLRSERGEVRALSDGGRRLYAPRPAPPGQDIRPRGQECRRGDHLLPAGVLVTPAVLGLAAASGYDELSVHPRPRTEVFVLGDELLDHGLPQEGRIRDALGPMLGPWLRALGVEASAPRRLADDADTLYAALVDSTADVVITTGGTASGPVDHVHPTLRRLGAEVLVDGVAVRPGHPMLLARLAPRRHLVGLPGNPLAAVSGLCTLAEPLLRTLAARSPAAPCRTPLASAVRGHPQDTRLVPVAYREDERHGLVAAPLRFHGPAMLRGIAAADALAVIPPGGAEAGAELEILELPWSAGPSADGC
ncbi:putative molybdenum cofactor biosynthesis protein [Streptomyces sp. NBRC 110611]|uniref:molybdopterin molybdotransferase MoeA n=1 Tax=Streptomyces sp. NBRC 110611 TaxID=1621259 RepID=UPI00085638F3|nr:molybdopterin molybdotransferase MoeA [Streptomyces sp. NBRC 110611]GAU66614.1 putative molybdenum cofactor biosynthesis protein [Streptomyces sp. NBRC 110611]